MRDDWMLQGDEECTVEVYIGWMRKYRAWCEPQGLDTSTMRGSEGLPGGTSRRKQWDGYMAQSVIQIPGSRGG